MEILELKKLKNIIENLEKNARYFHGDREVIKLYNSFLKLYNNLDIMFNLFDNNISLIPEDKIEHYQNYILTTLDSIELDYSLMDQLWIPKEILENCREILKKERIEVLFYDIS